jgi:hypothetical protein
MMYQYAIGLYAYSSAPLNPDGPVFLLRTVQVKPFAGWKPDKTVTLVQLMDPFLNPFLASAPVACVSRPFMPLLGLAPDRHFRVSVLAVQVVVRWWRRQNMRRRLVGLTSVVRSLWALYCRKKLRVSSTFRANVESRFPAVSRTGGCADDPYISVVPFGCVAALRRRVRGGVYSCALVVEEASFTSHLGSCFSVSSSESCCCRRLMA